MWTLWVPGPLPGLNEMLEAAKGAGGSGARYAKLKRQWTDTIWVLAKSQRLPRFPGRVWFRFTWSEAHRRRDPDNVAAGGRKLVLDGLVQAEVIKDDGWDVVGGWTDRFVIAPRGRCGVEVMILVDDPHESLPRS